MESIISSEAPAPSPIPEEIFAIDRPDSSLMTYYVLTSRMAGPFFIFVLLPLYFRYHTMRYRFTHEGVSMRWGILFRKEINLTFARIQDINLTSNLIERWLGLARIQIQTASGSAKAEMTIEGILVYRALRDFLYSRMRGARGIPPATTKKPGTADQPPPPPSAEVAGVLMAAVAELRAIRKELERRSVGGNEGNSRG